MYPKKVKLFIPWSKAMVAGATVGNPAYSGSGKTTKRRKRRRKRKHRAKKET